MDNDILKYGDFIVLYGFISTEDYSPVSTPNGTDHMQAPTEEGFLSAIGHTDNRVFLQKVPNIVNPLTSVAELNNHQDLVFQVWPKLTCEAHKQMRKFKKEKQMIFETINADEKENLDNLLDRLDVRIQEEMRSHQKTLKQVFGNTVTYGSDVQFMHVDSRSFLKAEISSSHSDKSAYKFELSNEFSSRMAFRINPKYNVRQEGEPIQFSDELLIHSVKLDCYVNFSLNNYVEVDMEIEVPSNLPVITKKIEVSKLNRGSKRYEAHVSQFQDCIWRPYFYGSHKDEIPVQVKGGDLIRFKHSQNGSYLAADICMQTKNIEVYGRLYYGQYEEEQNSINTIWSVEVDDDKDKNATCEILDENMKPKTLRLRHLLTGKVLHFSSELFKADRQTWKIPIISETQAATSNYSIGFHNFANKPKRELYYNTAYGIYFKTGDHNGQTKFITAHPIKDYADMNIAEENLSPEKEKKSLADHVKVFKPLRDSEFYTKKKTFTAEVTAPSAEHAFIVERVTPEEQADIALATSTLPILTHFRDLMKASYHIDQTNWEVFPKVISALSSLTLFLQKNPPKSSEIFDPLTFEGAKISSRQKILKDLSLIDILTEIIYYPFYLNVFTLQKIYDNNFITVFQHCYTLIRHIINENRPNELYASQWLELYMHQALAPNNVDIKAEATLIELIDNNKKILNSKIDSRIVRRFVNLLKETKQEKFINLLQALIVCDKEAVLKNQTETSRLIFEDSETCKALIPKIRLRNDDIEVWTDQYTSDPSDCWITLSEFHTLSHQKDDGKNINYFIGLVHLLANLCLDRNYIAINYLQDVFKYDICFKVISDNNKYKNFWEIKSAFARLMKTLWVDRKPYHHINLPTHLILWDEIDSKPSEEILTVQATNTFEGLINTLQDYFTRLSQEGCTKIYEVERNKFTFLALDLVMELAKFGFYPTVDKLKAIVLPLLFLLNGMADVMTESEYDDFYSLQNSKPNAKSVRTLKTKRTSLALEVASRKMQKYQEREDSLIVMDCKNKVCEIIKLVMAIGADISVRKFLTEYKKKVAGSKLTEKSTANQEKLLAQYVQEIKLISENDSLDIGKLAPTNYANILFELLRYEHKDLVSNAFDLLYMTYSKQNSLKIILQQVRLIEGANKTSVLQDIQIKIKELNELSEASENWYISNTSNGQAEFARFSQLIKEFEGYLLIQDASTKKDDAPVLAHDGEEGNSLLHNGDETERDQEFEIGNVFVINSEFQQIFRHLKVHEPLINILKFEYSERNRVTTRTDAQTKLLNEISKFLTKLTYREATTQDLLTAYIDRFFKMLKKYPDIGIEGTIEEIFRNNSKLVKEPETIQKFAETIIKLFRGRDVFTYKNSRLLQTLIVLMTHNGKALKTNQVTIVSLLTSRENVPTFFGFLRKTDDIKAKLQVYDKKVQEVTAANNIVELPADLDYIASMIQVLATSAEGKNVVSEAKTQGLLSLPYLVSLYESSKHCWHLKLAIANLFLHAFLDTEREKKDEAANIGKLLNAMVSDMERLNTKQNDYEVLFSKGRVNSNVLKEITYYRGILSCINVMITKMIYKGVHNSSEILTKALEILVKNHESASKEIYKKKVKSSLRAFKVFLREIYNNVCSNLKLGKSPMNISYEIGGSLILHENLTMVVRDENSRVHQLKRMLDRISKRPDFRNNVHIELEKLIEALVDIEKNPLKNVYSADLPFGEIVKSVIKAIDATEDTVSKELKRAGLLMLRKVIENENKFEQVPAADWDDDKWTKNENIIKERQNNLCELGVIEMAFNMISYSNDADLQYEGILLCIALLMGGNCTAQDIFLENMKNDSENTFLSSIRHLITSCFEIIKKALSEKNRSFLKKMQVVLEQEKLGKKRTSVLDKFMVGLNEVDSEIDEVISHIDHEEVHQQEVSQALVIMKRVYKFLGLLCHGHHSELQSHLRCQKTADGHINRRTYDFITSTASHFNALVKQINIDSLDLAVLMMDFLIGTALGPCEENQKALIKANIINSCMDFLTTFKTRNDYMRRGFFSQEEMNRVEDPTITSMKLLNALIEACIDPEMMKEMDSLDFRFLIEKLSVFYSGFVKKKFKANPETTDPQEITMRMKAETFDEKVIESFDVYFLILKLSDYSHKAAVSLTEIGDYDALTKNTLEFFKINSANIEIVFGEKLLKVYFPLYPACRCLTKAARTDLMQNVNRASPNEKIIGLIEASPQMFDEMDHLLYLKHLIFNFSIRKYNFLRDLATLFSFLMNLLLVTTTYYGVMENITIRYDHPIGSAEAIYIGYPLNGFQVGTSFLMFVFWIIIYTPMLLRGRWRDHCKDKQLSREEELRLAELIDERTLGGLPLRTVLNLLWRKGPYDPIFYKNGSKDFGHLFVRVVYYFKNLIFIFSDGRFIYMLFYFIISLVGLLVSEITYCFQLLDVINRFDTLKNVVKSVTYNIKQLALTGLLGLILIYIYSIIGFVFVDDQYFSGDSNERSCTSLWHCYVTTINYGLRNGGGIGESLEAPSYETSNQVNYYFRTIFDLSFFLIINIVFLNIVFGIIIDTFAELRDAKKTIDEDMKNVCFICNTDRYTLDKDGSGFTQHTENNHNLWNYVFFLYNLEAQNPLQFNGIETYVKEKLDTQDISWVPQQRALELEPGPAPALDSKYAA